MGILLQKTMLIGLVLAFAIPSSLGSMDTIEVVLREVCSGIERAEECIDLLTRAQLSRFNGSSAKDLAGPIIDLTTEKAQQIHNMLMEIHQESNDYKLKTKYESCSSNYKDSSCDLDVIKRNLDSIGNINQDILNQMADIEHELEECTREFKEGSFDPAHVGDRNKEFGLYVDILKVAMDRWMKVNEDYQNIDYDYYLLRGRQP